MFNEAEKRLDFDNAQRKFGIRPQNDVVRLEPDQTLWYIYPVNKNFRVGLVEVTDRDEFIASLISPDPDVLDDNPLKAATDAWNAHLSRKSEEERQRREQESPIKISSYMREDGVSIGRSERDPLKWRLFDHDRTPFNFVAREFRPNESELIIDLDGPSWTTFENAMKTLKTVKSIATETHERI